VLQKRDILDAYDHAPAARFGVWVGIWVALCSSAVNIRSISNDNIPNVLLPISILRQGNLELSEYQPLIAGHKDRVCYWAVKTEKGIYSRYPIWPAVVATPFFAPAVLFGPEVLDEAFLIRIGRFAAMAGCAAFAGLLAVTLRRCVSGAWAVAITFFTVMGSTVQHQLGANLSNQTLPIVCVAAVLFLIFRVEMSRPRALAAGLLAGLAVAARLPVVFMALALLGVFVSQQCWRRSLGYAVLGFSIFPLLTCVYQAVAFGSPFATGYGEEPNAGFNAPLWTGAGGLLISPTCGLFVYSPWVILAFVGGWRCIQGRALNTSANSLGRWLVLGFIGQWLLFSTWWAWNGALSFGGPRLLAETLPALALLIAAGGILSTSGVTDAGRAARRLVMVLGVVSALHFLVGTAAYDAVAPLNPVKPDFEYRADFLSLYLAKFGPRSLVMASLQRLAILSAAFLIGGGMVWRILRPAHQFRSGAGFECPSADTAAPAHPL